MSGVGTLVLTHGVRNKCNMPHPSLKQYRYDITVFETGGTVDGKPCYGACVTGAAQGDNVILAAPTQGEAAQHLIDTLAVV